MPRTTPLWRMRAFQLVAIALCLVAAPLSAARAQVFSADDSLKIVLAPTVSAGEVIDVAVHLRTQDTLGAFNFRMRYDPQVFAPLLDTVIENSDTTVLVVSTQLHPGPLEHFAGAVREPGIITFIAVDFDLDTSSLFLPGSWPVVRMRWRVAGSAPQGPTSLDFENDPAFPASYNTLTDWRGTSLVRPVLTGAVTNVLPGPVPSDVDSMRIITPSLVARGQEIDVDIRLRVVDTLGAFAYRIRYDTIVFEPVQDTFVIGGDTLIGIIAFDLHPGAFEQFAGSVREPGVITFLGADLDLDTGSLYLPGSWPAVRMKWRVRSTAPVGPTAIAFENDSVFPATWNAFSDWRGDDFVRPVLVNTTTVIGCACGCFAEAGSCDGSLDIADVMGVVDIAFRGLAGPPDPNPLCPAMRSDVDCDGITGIVDVIKIIEVAFRGADPTTTFCDPCE